MKAVSCLGLSLPQNLFGMASALGTSSSSGFKSASYSLASAVGGVLASKSTLHVADLSNGSLILSTDLNCAKKFLVLNLYFEHKLDIVQFHLWLSITDTSSS